MNKYLSLLPLAFLSFAAQACNVADIQVHDATVLAGVPGHATNTAGYARIHNAGDQACEIIGASSDIAKEVQLHTVEKVQDRLKMVPVKEFKVPAKGDLLLSPGGNHLMFMGLTKTLKPAEQVEITLKFKEGGEKKVMAKIQDMREAPAVNHKH
jgi:copper(I)-binding protein